MYRWLHFSQSTEPFDLAPWTESFSYSDLNPRWAPHCGSEPLAASSRPIWLWPRLGGCGGQDQQHLSLLSVTRIFSPCFLLWVVRVRNRVAHMSICGHLLGSELPLLKVFPPWKAVSVDMMGHSIPARKPGGVEVGVGRGKGGREL